MSTLTLTKWGNSVGIRIPAIIMKELHLAAGAKLEFKVSGNVLSLISVKNQQAGWTEMFNVLADSKNEDHIDDISSEFDETEWTF